MKSALDWVHKEDTRLRPTEYYPGPVSLSSLTFSEKAEHSDAQLTEFVKQIQLDAWKQGMSDAIDSLYDMPSDLDKRFILNNLVTERNKKEL